MKVLILVISAYLHNFLLFSNQLPFLLSPTRKVWLPTLGLLKGYKHPICRRGGEGRLHPLLKASWEIHQREPWRHLPPPRLSLSLGSTLIRRAAAFYSLYIIFSSQLVLIQKTLIRRAALYSLLRKPKPHICQKLA